jgi:hypothetical protein
MLTRLIVASYAWLLETALWITLVLAGVTGFHVTVPLMHSAGAIVTPEFAWRILGALAFAIIAFLVLAVFAGPVLVLMDVRQAVRNIEDRLERRPPEEDIRGPLRFESREPSI